TRMRSDHVAVGVLERLDELYAIGGGTRAGYSPEEDAAHELAAGWMREAGLEVGQDEAGNLFGRRGDARVWSGSHLDSVPNGGRFDGALGVVAAIEAAARLPEAPLAVVAFRAEETGPMGSRKLTELPDAFVELHIEQGPVLERASQPLGLVSAIGFEPAWRLDPVPMSGAPLDALRAVLPEAPELVSGAGHDAMVLAAAGVPTAMLFVRSLNGGASHSPDELSSAEDVELAVDALTATLDRLARP